MIPRLVLLRHAAVSQRYQGRCYGRSDVELSSAGEQRSDELSKLMATWPIRHIVHSGLQRTRFLAERLAAEVGVTAECSAALRERDFGEWELQSWDAIFERDGNEMLKMLSEPGIYRPGGGETTFELRDRVVEWYEKHSAEDLTVAITHGGRIAALCGSQNNVPAHDWLNFVPACGDYVVFE